MKAKVIILLLLLIVSLSACAGPQAVKNGEVTDMITNVEPRASGYYMIWVRTDITSAYCTDDLEVVRNAKAYREFLASVTITYTSINFGDKDATVFGFGGCDHEMEGVRVYRLDSLRLADVETTRTPPWLMGR